MRDGGWHGKCSKCKVFLLEAEFLGHRITADGVWMVPGKVEAISTWPTPTSLHDVQAFLGLCNYYCRFCKNFAKMVKPLTDLTRKGVEFVWDIAHAEALTELKQLLATAPVL